MDYADNQPSTLGALLSVYAREHSSRHRLLWALDARLARLVATTGEPMIGQIRLTWWNDALTDETGVKGRGDPLIDALRDGGLAPPVGLTGWLDGWEALIGDIDLEVYASGRGGGLFCSLADEMDVPEWLVEAGAVWALWDLSGHTGNAAMAAQAVTQARRRVLKDPLKWPAAWRPMRIAYALARHDVMRGRQAPKTFTPGLYLRLMWLALRER